MNVGHVRNRMCFKGSLENQQRLAKVICSISKRGSMCNADHARSSAEYTCTKNITVCYVSARRRALVPSAFTTGRDGKDCSPQGHQKVTRSWHRAAPSQKRTKTARQHAPGSKKCGCGGCAQVQRKQTSCVLPMAAPALHLLLHL
jgi:hypothetical protein